MEETSEITLTLIEVQIHFILIPNIEQLIQKINVTIFGSYQDLKDYKIIFSSNIVQFVCIINCIFVITLVNIILDLTLFLNRLSAYLVLIIYWLCFKFLFSELEIAIKGIVKVSKYVYKFGANTIDDMMLSYRKKESLKPFVQDLKPST